MGEHLPEKSARAKVRVIEGGIAKNGDANAIALPDKEGVPTLDLTLLAPIDPRGLAEAQRSIFEMPDDERDRFRFDEERDEDDRV